MLRIIMITMSEKNKSEKYIKKCEVKRLMTYLSQEI